MNLLNKLRDTLTEYVYKFVVHLKREDDHTNINTNTLEEGGDEICILTVHDSNMREPRDLRGNWEEVKRYLNHHIRYTNDTFKNMVFENPVHVRFEYKGEVYRICLKGMKSTKNDHKEIVRSPLILFATFMHKEEEVNITDTLKEYHGHERNFFDHIPDAITDLSRIVNKEGNLRMYDMMGRSTVLTLKN